MTHKLLPGTNREFLTLLRGLEGVKEIKGTRFAMLVSKNIKELTNHLRFINEAAIPSPEFQEISKIAMRYAEEQNAEAITALEAEHNDLVEARKEQLKNVEKMLEEEAKVALVMIRADQLPEDLTTEQLLPILSIIEE